MSSVESCLALLVKIVCMDYITPEFIMTMKDSLVKLFVKSILLTFMALTDLNLM